MHSARSVSAALLSLLAAGAALGAAGARGKAAAPQAELRFDRDVRPILAENCFACHGPDPAARQGGLRLDRKADLLAKRPTGAPVVPGSPEGSRIWVRIAAEGARQMPPPGSGKQLTSRQKELVRRWIAQGAAYTQHWAFVPPRRPPLPRVKNASWPRNPVDAFVLARLEKAGLAPSPPADRTTLLRRLSLDLVGLPPTPEEVDAFLADRRPDAYERQVDRLLASPHYGERWGRHWLDAARYADSDGFEKDKPRAVWFYRDWVVNALNRDLPYDQFVIQQIAGDLLEPQTPAPRSPGSQASLPIDPLVATGFLRNSMLNEEGGVDPEQFRMEAMFDRMDAIGKSVLGLTIQCAQCHSHKYDPLTQEEYYRLFAFLNNSDEGNVAVYTPADEMKRAEVFRGIRAVEARLQHEHPDWPERQAAWEAAVRDDQPAWRIVRPAPDASGGQKHLLRADGSILAQGYAPTKHGTEFTVRVDDGPVTAVRLELLTDPNLPRGGPGRSIAGLCALTEFRVQAAPADQPDAKQAIKIASATADVNPAEQELAPIFDDRSKRRRVTGPVAYAIDGKDETAWGLDVGPGRSNLPRKAVFVLEKAVAFPAGALLTFSLVQNHGGWNSDDNQNNNLGAFRFAVTAAEGVVADPLPAAARSALAVPSPARSAAQAAALFSAWRTTVPEWAAANAAIEHLWQEHPQPATQLVLHEREERRPTHLLERGDFLKPAKAVTPGVPSFLHALPAGGPPNRLTFARWLVDPRSPTTARSLVNRVWQSYFGTGIVRTSEDLGLQSEAPSHPELLDWLAVEFMQGVRGEGDGGVGVARTRPPSPHPVPWSLKSLHRLIVTSSTYRQASTWRSSDPRSAIRNPQLIDPENRLLWRGARLRVEGEIVRDVALTASGLLDPRVGGPSVFPPAPEFLFVPPASYGPKQWPLSTGPDRYRRSLYTFRYRSVPYPALQVFDTPNGDQACVRRTRSNTPLQALTTLNEPLFLECARALALKAVREGGATDAERLTYAFRRCLARRPSAAERSVLLDLLERQAEHYAAAKLDPWDLAAPDETTRPALPEGMSPARLAAWTVVARALLNLDETITKE
jgi:hypothetical protein